MTGSESAKVRLAASVRDLVDAVVRVDARAADDPALTDLLEAIGWATAGIRALASAPGLAELLASGSPDAELEERSGIGGRSNPLAPPVDVRVWGEPARATASVTFGKAYEGPPGRVHGGFVAAAFDEVLGRLAMHLDPTARTATLELQLRAATPLYRPIQLVAELEHLERRKLWLSARSSLDGEVLVHGRALLIIPRPALE